MEKKLFVASLSFKIRDEDLRIIFEEGTGGKVISAKVIMDRDGRSRGYGFVEMSTSEEAEIAIRKLNGTNHFGRDIVVNKQKPQEQKPYSQTPTASTIEDNAVSDSVQ